MTHINTTKFVAANGFEPAGQGLWNFGLEGGRIKFSYWGTYSRVACRARTDGEDFGYAELFLFP